MLACLTYDFGDMRIEDISIPQVQEGWVLVRIEVCQPSVTEVMRFRGVGNVKEIKERLEKESPLQLFGHEFSGRIVSIGQGVKRFQEGQRVSSRGGIPCGNCICCQRGDHDFCMSMRRIGVGFPGCFAEYVLLPEVALEPVPTGVDPNEAACLQPLSTAVASVDSAKIKFGDTVVVLGLGVMGLYCAQLAKITGAGTVVGFDIKDENLELARTLGIDVVVDALNNDVNSFIRDLTKGVGADVVFECAGGSPEEGLSGHKTIGQAFEIVRTGGSIIQISHPLPGKTLPFELTTLTKKKIKYIGLPNSTSLHFYQGAKLVALKKIDIKSLISHVLEGIDKVPEAFEITGNKTKYKATNPAQVVIWRE